jgi:hypothetical protein
MENDTRKMNKLVCVNVGTKYPPEYTRRLYNMVKRNTVEPFEFYVYTDQKHLYTNDPFIIVEDDGYERGWWCKLNLFKPGMLPPGKYLYLDLDVVIVDNIDELFKLPTFGILRDFIRPENGILPGKEYNSSVMVFEPEHRGDLFKFYTKNKMLWENYSQQVSFFGDQNVISAFLNKSPTMCKPIPDEWVWSFKKGAVRGAHAGDRSRHFGDVIPHGGKICVFHGNPNPTEVETNWVKEHYV